MVRQIIIAARQQSGEFGLLIEVAAITGARVGQLSLLEVKICNPTRLHRG